MNGPAQNDPTILIRGGRVYDAANPDLPPLRDVIVEDGRIRSVTAPAEAAEDKQRILAQARSGAAVVIDATDRLILPGFVNAHYHSYDTLAKGMLEEMPFDVWALYALPGPMGARSKAELRIRTLLGAIECLKSGITTVQDMCTLVPRDEETLDVIAAAYAEAGIRVVFSVGLRDIPDFDIAPFLPDGLPAEVKALLHGAPGDARADLSFVEAQVARLGARRCWHWGISPSGPQRSSRALLEGVADLAGRLGLPIFTHVYETKAQAAKARMMYKSHGGSMIRAMDEIGLLGPTTTLAHGVWLAPDEIDILASRGTGVALNPLSNMKLKSGIAPLRRLRAAGVPLALGCDNCSCGDCQNMFQAMKMFYLLSAVSGPDPSGLRAADAVDAATAGGARAVGLGARVGAVRPGCCADLALLDLRDIAYLPLNSVARQLVLSDTGSSVRTVIVDGRIVVHEKASTMIEESAFRAELDDLMTAYRHDFEQVRAASAVAVPYLLDANRRLGAHDLGLNRFIPG